MLDELLTRACPCCKRNLKFDQRLVLLKHADMSCPHCTAKLMGNTKDEWVSNAIILIPITFSGIDYQLGDVVTYAVNIFIYFALIRLCRCLFTLEKYKKKKD